MLVASLREALARRNSITLFGPDNSAGIVSFAMAGVHPHDIGTILDESGVAIRAGHHCAQPLMEHRSEEHTSELQSLMRISYAVFCLQQKKTTHQSTPHKTIPQQTS